MKIQTFLTVLSIILLGFLLFFNMKNSYKSNQIQEELDSAMNKINCYEKEKETLRLKNDSLMKINDSLRINKTVTIYNEIKYKYGKEIALLDSSNIKQYLDILSK